MELEWIGRYRAVVLALTRHSNIVNRALTTRHGFADGIELSAQELQVLENLIEHDGEWRIMLDVAVGLGIPKSSMSKATRHLLDSGLIRRFRLEGNRKSVILRPSDKGRELYFQYCELTTKKLFAPFFSKLEGFSDGELTSLANAIEALNSTLEADSDKRLVEY